MNMVGSSVVVVVLANYPFQARELAWIPLALHLLLSSFH